ncbi:MAG: formylglycine-generating enzyme family protein, partial [Nitrospirales bacterium]
YWAGRTIDFQSGADWDAFWINGEGAKISKEKGIKGEVLTMPVASFPEIASPYGLQDKAGNVAEWVQDWYNPNYYNEAPLSDPQGPPRGAIKAIRGRVLVEAGYQSSHERPRLGHHGQPPEWHRHPLRKG